jgi:hypothetical protein
VLAAAAGLLLAGSAYGVLASETPERVDRWNPDVLRPVESGFCARDYRLLPSLDPRPPHFIRIDGRTYIRAGRAIRPPRGLVATGYRRQSWVLHRKGAGLFLVAADEPTAIPYKRGACPVSSIV